ncbi:MAG: 23S rRNA (uracil(1939)-C(5))-methyltransferase RlmD [Sinobacteraceae bacterium]|nr:23S rRNA (uracil(1939)-C(5))-methyltransferase RlmD [Nevskiaceae bacterium]
MSRASRRALPDLVEEGVVIALNHDGDGVIRDSKTVFVAGALEGERVRFQRTAKHRQHDEAKLLEVLEASPSRVEPRCAHFGICGGCALQHLSPTAQLASKQNELAATLERIGKVTPREWLAPIEGPTWGYRRRARLGAKYVAKRGRVLVGFRERNKPYVAALERCEILASPVDALITPLAELLTGLEARQSIPQIEVAVGESVTVLVFRVLEDLSSADRAALLAFEAAQQGLRVYVQRGGPDTVQPLQGEAARLHYTLPAEGLRYEFLPTDFVQINAEVNRALVTHAVTQLQVGPSDRVLDLFCGLGNFTLPIARRAREVLGLEGDAALVERARHNAALNKLDNAHFKAANLFDPAVFATVIGGAVDRVLLDPPRAGALEILPQLAALAPRRMVYVSCHPGTLARDLGVLCHEHGFQLVAAGVIDMFPHTHHVESIAVLERSR